MRQQQQRIQSFNEVLSRFSSKDVLSAIFEDFKLEISTNHPAKELGLNQASKSTKEFILIQRNEILRNQENNVNGNNSIRTESVSSSVNDSTLNDSVPGIKVDDLSEVLEADVVESDIRPVSIDQARSLMFLYSQSLRKIMFETPICIVCDGKDPEKTCLIEASPVIKDSSVAGIKVTTITSSGPLHTKSDLMKMDQLIMMTSPTAASQCVTSGFAMYVILGKSSMADMSMLPGQQQQCDTTTVNLDCSWEDIKNVLETPHGANCTVHIKAVPGNMNSSGHRVFCELNTLVGFAAGAISGQIQWINPTSSSTSSIATLLAELIESVKQGEKKRILEENEHKDSPLKGNQIPERDDLDFTERLWVLLKDNARCYNDIVSTIKTVLGELQSGQLQPMVHSSNCTTLAKHIRASYHQNMTLSMKDVEGLEPLRMLIEIGVEKLKRDYLAFFIGQELTTLDKLQWYVSPPNASDLTLEELVRRLQSLHQVVELYAVGTNSLHLPHKTKWTLVRCGLNYYENPQSRHDDDHTFTIQVERAAMLRFYSSFHPSVWRVEAKHGSTGVDMKRTVYQVTVDRPFQHISYDQMNGYTNALDQTGIDGDQFVLYQTLATSSQITVF
ncbi:LOW QUALITY PROTEIN: protein zwilch homolog [Amphiura filiformis]|uniref:LOW QUALITY PROTEIN: protein zwilch homolog n=1 Tax=Amphiura filiformis TaxID=82378 RepID=UPI003B21DF21